MADKRILGIIPARGGSKTIPRKNIKSILNFSNFKINHISKNEYHGGSLRTFAAKKESKLKEFSIKNLLNYEIKNRIYNLDFYNMTNSEIKNLYSRLFL